MGVFGSRPTEPEALADRPIASARNDDPFFAAVHCVDGHGIGLGQVFGTGGLWRFG